MGWKYGAGTGLLKRGGGGGGGGEGAGMFPNFFKVYHFYILKLRYPLQSCVAFQEKLFFSATIIL